MNRRAWSRFLRLGLPLWLSACAGVSPPPDRLALEKTSFEALSGWDKDRLVEAVPALRASCAVFKRNPAKASVDVLQTGTKISWLPFCQRLETVAPQDEKTAREIIEKELTPYAVTNKSPGLFTGYYEPLLHGSLTPQGRYQTPLWPQPMDLLTVDLGAFKDSLRGQKIAGKIKGRALVPYDDRGAVARGSLTGRAAPLVWVDSPFEAFFLEIQGSGRIELTDGTAIRLSYAAQNGQTYVPIGRLLAEEGAIERPVTQQKIKTWLETHPDQAQAAMNRNPSVVFFRQASAEGGPQGAQGVALTPRRSLAVDPRFIPLGAPLWLETETQNRLVVAQDTGGAIKGPVRGDLFWGFGPEAEIKAGEMQENGTFYLLLPKEARIP